MLFSVVIPVYNEADLVGELCRQLQEALDPHRDDFDAEVIFVNDGSSDTTLEKLGQARASDPRFKILNLTRNFGHQLAITAGIDHAKGDWVAVMDADLQDPPSLLPDMLKKLSEGYDVVYGQRRTRVGESSFKLLTAGIFYRMMRSLTRVDIPVDTGDFRVMSRRMVDDLSKVRESNRFMRGLVSWVGYRQTGLPYDRRERYSGTTKYPLRAMLNFAWDGITSFSVLPLRLATLLGLLSILIGLGYACFVFYANLTGIVHLERGWSSIIVIMLFFSGVQLLILGVIGEYIGRISEEVKRRPLYLVERFDN